MITSFEDPDQKIDLNQLIGRRGRFLVIREAQKRDLELQLLIKKRKHNSDLLYLRIQKDKKVRWLSPQRGYFNSKTSCDLALFKHLTYKILNADGLPVPKFKHIKKDTGLDDIDYFPVVVKPIAKAEGKDVIIEINNKEQLEQACRNLFGKYKNLLVEKMIFGKEYRLLVLDKKVIAASERKPPKIRGDGRKTVSELIEENNKNRRDDTDDFTPFLKTLEIDPEMERYIKEQGYNLNSIPPKDQTIHLRRNANFTTGGEVEDVTDKIHPENKKTAVRAIKSLGLKLGGVDIITPDISKPMAKEGGKIIEINGIPGLWIHHFPHYGKPRNPAGKILDYLFKD